MKNLLFFITATTIFYLPGAMQAQQVPQFQMTIHFEDAVGNKDSIIIGYDSNAVFGPNLIDTQFGESIINEPFDSIFEVRVAVAVDSNWNYLTAKKAINPLSDVEGSSCGLIDGLIYMNVRHWPITIRYDSAHLNSNPCHADAILTPDEIVFLVPNWQEHVRVIYCLGHTDSIQDRYDHYFEMPDENWMHGFFEVEGTGITQLPAYYYSISPFNFGYCATISDTETPDKPTALSGRLYPNPNRESSVILELNEPPASAHISLYDLNGRRLRQLTSFLQQTISIDIEGLPAGAYVVEVISSQKNKPAYYKLIRQ